MSAGSDSFTSSDGNGAFEPHETHEGLECREFRKSRKSPGFHECHVSPVFLVSPVSSGQELEGELKGLAARNACTEHNTAWKRDWQLARDLKAVEVRLGRELDVVELTVTSSEWFSRSQPFLEQGETCEDHLAALIAKIEKVRVPSGKVETLKKALACVKTLSDFELPEIPGMPQAGETWRRVAALHRELCRLSTKKDKSYFLSYRDAAKASPGISPQKAHDITRTLARFRVIKIVSKGKAGLNSGEAAEFRYLLL